VSDPLEYSSYSFEGRDELCLKAGVDHSNQILLIPPLFDEMNRMRRMLVDSMRALDTRGIGSILPDLPGSNESLFPQADASFDLWRKALSQCTAQHSVTPHVASFRGSALVDDFDSANKIWRLSPAKGNSLLRTMMRTRIASDKEAGTVTTMAALSEQAESSAINLAGNDIGPQMFKDLQETKLSDHEHVRTVRLESDSQPADAKLLGTALWLRAEPDEDMALSQAIADDIAGWIES